MKRAGASVGGAAKGLEQCGKPPEGGWKSHWTLPGRGHSQSGATGRCRERYQAHGLSGRYRAGASRWGAGFQRGAGGGLETVRKDFGATERLVDGGTAEVRGF